MHARVPSQGLPSSARASVIVTALMFVIVLSMAGAALMSRSLATYRLADRNTVRMEAQAVADSELEALFYRWKLLLRKGVTEDRIASVLEAQGFIDEGLDPTSSLSPLSDAHRARGWTVRRGLQFDKRIVGAESGGSGRRTGGRTFYTATVEVSGGPANNPVSVETRRRLVISESSLFQFAIFYQGDLEIASGSRLDVRGPVTSNGNMHIGGANNQRVIFYDRVSFGGTLNGDRNGMIDKPEFMRHPDSPTPPAGAVPLVSPRFTTARRNVVVPLAPTEKENFIGGLDVGLVLEQTDVFANENEVYHSVISPPPPAPAKDLPAIEARRLYNQAGLRLRVGSTEPDGLDLIEVSTGRSLRNLPNFQSFLAGLRTPSNLYDHREGRTVEVSTVDLHELSAALKDAPGVDFNGILYVEHVAPARGAVRIQNAETVPGEKGFTFATNTGLYIQGDFNTSSGKSDGSPVSAAIAADAITLLSENWSDANASADISQRVATKDISVVAGLLTGNTPTANGRNSGGAQNLVRLMEDWRGRKIKLKGSIGQLFASRYFTGAFPTQLGSVYNLPSSRMMEFDSLLSESPPPGRLGTVSFLRGDYVARSGIEASLAVRGGSGTSGGTGGGNDDDVEDDDNDNDRG